MDLYTATQYGNARGNGYDAGYAGNDPASNPHIGTGLESTWLRGWADGVDASTLAELESEDMG